MELIDNLISVLKSERDLINDLYSLLQQEVSSIVKWDMVQIDEINKKKNTYYCKERFLEEAIKSSLEKLRCAFDNNNLTIEELISNLEDNDQKKALCNIKSELLDLLQKVNYENTKIRILYKNNIKIIDEFFNRIGITNTLTYTKNKKFTSKLNMAFSKKI